MPNISINDPDLRMIHIEGFPQGVNEFESASGLKPNEPVVWLVDAQNVNIRDRSIMRGAAGQAFYIDKNYLGMDLTIPSPPNAIQWYEPVYGAYRYRSSSDLKRILMVSGDKLAMDLDDGRFDRIGGFTGRPNFTRWRDVAIIQGASESPAYFNGHTLDRITMDSFCNLGIGGNTVNGGGGLTDGQYRYRFTMSSFSGDVFIGETGAVITNSTGEFLEVYSNTIGFGDDGITEIRKLGPNTIPPYVRHINVYRQFKDTADTAAAVIADRRVDYNDFFWIGSVDVSDLNNAALGDVLISDKGYVQPQDAIPFVPLFKPPHSAVTAWHKGRLWVMSPNVSENKGGLTYSLEHHCDRIYASRIGVDGPEPGVFDTYSWEYVGRGEPFDATGIRSIRNEFLLITKPDSCWAVYGGDDEADGAVLINVKMLDGSIGCVAPLSMHEVDGGVLAWWAANGPVYFDGSGPPRYLMAEKIRKTARRIPGNRMQFIASAYSKKHRESTFFYSLENDEAYNRHYSTFNWETRTWVHGTRRLGVSTSVNVDDETSDGYTLYFVDDDPASMVLTHRLVIQADVGGREAVGSGDAAIHGYAKTPLMHGGRAFEDKHFLGIQLEVNTPVRIYVDYSIDNVFDSEKTGDGFYMDLPITEDTWVWDAAIFDESRWPLDASGFDYKAFKRANGATIPVGKAISIKLSWSSTSVPLEFSSATVFFKTVGVRK